MIIMNSVQTTVRFDMRFDSTFCEGTLTLCNGLVEMCLDGDSTVFSLENVREARQFTDIGCGRLELVPADAADELGTDNIPVCRFSMSCINEIGEFVKVINHYLRSGEQLEISKADSRVCPGCGRHLPDGIDVCLFCVKKTYVFKRAFTYFKKYTPQMIFSGILLTFASAASALVPVFSKILLDDYISPSSDATPYFDSAVKGIVMTVLMMGAAFLAGQVLTVISSVMSNRIGSRFSHDLRTLVYDKIQILSLSSISKKTSGDLIKRVTRDTENVKDFFNQQGRYIIQKGIMFIVVLAVLFKTDAPLTLLVLLPVPFGFMIIRRFWSVIHLRYEKQWRADSRATSVLHDIIKGIRVVKSFGNEEREIEKFSGASESLAKISASNEKFWALTFPVVGNFMAIGEYLVLWFGGIMVLRGTLSVGELYMFTMYLSYLYTPLRWMSSLPRRIADTSTSLLKLYEIIDEVPSVTDAAEPQKLNAGGAIEFKDVEFGYKAYEPVLKDINLKIEPGEMIGLVGHSGAGKSTLINLCMRLYDPTLGSITVDGCDLKSVSQSDLRESIGVVFQETYLFSGSVYENISYAREDASPEEVIAAAKAANAHEFIMKLSDGYNTKVGENGHALSGGERQRIAIARAVLKNPKILILDEATSSLDPETEEKIQDALARLTANRTTIAIAHRLSTLRNADRLVVIEKGRIAELGSHRELMEHDGIYRALVVAQRQTAKLKAE